MLDSLFIRFERRYRAIPFAEIEYIRACRNYISISTGTQNYLLHLSMKEVEEKLPANLFCRIHKSCIVSLNKIQAFDQDYVYLNKIRLDFGAQYTEPLKRKLIILSHELKKKNVEEHDAPRKL